MGDGSDIVGLRRVVGQPTFNADKFVKNISKDGDEATNHMAEKLAQLSDEASNKIKRAIFDNYKLFIKAGKAATQLETTMHQIHNDFIEKQRIMHALAELSLFNDPSDNVINVRESSSESKDETKGPVSLLSQNAGITAARLAELVEGVTALAADKDRQVILDGDLRELSTNNFTCICTARIFLLTDKLVIAYSQSNSSAKYSYRLQACYDLNDINVMNIPPRDRRYTPLNTFKLLVFPATRIFQAQSPSEKQLWLHMLDEAIHKHRNLIRTLDLWHSQSQLKPNFISKIKSFAKVTKPVETKLDDSKMMQRPNISSEAALASFNALSSTLPECIELLTPIKPSETSARKNPFGDSSQNEKPTENPTNPEVGKHKSRHNWLWDVPEDLDVAITERDFTRATDLVVKSRLILDKILEEFSNTGNNTSIDNKTNTTSNEHGSNKSDIIDYRSKFEWGKLSKQIEHNERCLTDSLQYELMNAANRHGAPKSVCAAVTYLGRLGKSTLAAQLFLLYRSQIMVKSLTHGVHQEGNQLIYLNKLSLAFHRNIAETASEWHQSVIQSLCNYSACLKNGISSKQLKNALALKFYSWVMEETDKFSHQLQLLLTDSHAVSFYAMAHAAQRIKVHSDKLTELLGIDISSTIYSGLTKAWQRAADEQSRVLYEAVQHRAKQETWDGLSNITKSEQEKLIADMTESGFFNQYSSVTYGPNLTMSTYHLVRSFRQFLQSANLLDCQEVNASLVSCFVNVVQAESENYQRAVTNKSLNSKKLSIVNTNLEFMVHVFVPKFTSLLNCSQNPSLKKSISTLQSLCDKASEG